MDIAVIIPAQETNKYHSLGDLAPFGDTTLLEWKISQCKELTNISNIFVTSDSIKIKKIAQKEDVNFIQRVNTNTYTEIILHSISNISQNTILWTNPTAPFISKEDYKTMIEKFDSLHDYDSLLSVSEKKDYAYFKNSRLNFEKQLSSRSDLEPLYIVTNGCYIIKKNIAIQAKSLYGEKPYLYNLDYLSSIEIKDISTYLISQELISMYFKRDLDV
jgi:CMP-N-acetylneuraminic acid synthetase